MTVDPNDSSNLPLDVVDREASERASTPWWRLVFVPLFGGVVMFGGVMGMYFQPPGLKLVMGTLGIEPGGGTTSPIAIPAHPKVQKKEAPKAITGVAGIGKLIPRGDVMALAPPFGAGDARIQDIRVNVGDVVEANQILVSLDNEASLHEIVAAARANLAVKKATLAQTQQSTQVGRAEAEASLAQLEATATQARLAWERAVKLHKDKAISDSELEQLVAQNDAAKQNVERARATLSRFAGKPANQVDVVVATRTLEAARVELEKADRDLEKAYIRAPLPCTVLEIMGRVGQRPGPDGVLKVGDLAQMVAEIEVYQSQIGRVKLGQKVTLSADAVDPPLTAVVSTIGLSVGRQTLVGSDPASNTDARVLKVYADLDEASSQRAARFTNLQVVAEIEVDQP